MSAARFNAVLAASGYPGLFLSKAEGFWYLLGDDGVTQHNVERCLHAVRLSDLTDQDVLRKAAELCPNINSDETNTMNIAQTTPPATRAFLTKTAEARIATCNIYVNSRSLQSHNWVVVSRKWQGRGAFQKEVNGVLHDAVGPYPNGMPTCYTQGEATYLCLALNRHFEGKEEFRIMPAREWWQNELAEAQRTLDAVAAIDITGEKA